MTYTSPQVEICNEVLEHDNVAFVIVAGYVLLALGATIVLGAIAWCFMYARTGLGVVWDQKNGTYKVGCWN